MGAKSKSKSKTKKGPKGKKARAKAKLEQVWGEHVDENERKASRTRVGKSRLLPSSNTKSAVNNSGLQVHGRTIAEQPLARNHQVAKKVRRRDRLTDDSSSDDTESDDDNDVGRNGNSVLRLLKRIRRPDDGVNTPRGMDTDSDQDDASNSSTEGENESRMDSSIDDSDDDDTSDAKSNSSSEEIERKSPITAVDVKGISVLTDQDPFEAHFSKPPLPQLDPSSEKLKSTQLQIVPLTENSRKVDTPMLNSAVDVQLSGPLLEAWNCLENAMSNRTSNAEVSNGKISRKKNCLRKIWEEFTRGPYRHAREVLTRNWSGVNEMALKRGGKVDSANERNASNESDVSKVFSSLQLVLYPAIARYADVLVTTETRQNRDEINNILAMHVLEHVLTSKTRVQRHTRRIKELSSSLDAENPVTDNDDVAEDEDKWRDQGYTSPKVLILFPTRGTCWKFVHLMMKLLGESATSENEERFDAEYGPPPSDEESSDKDGNEADDKEEVKRARRKMVLKQKGQEWNELFGDDTNDDDDFKIGMSLTPNVVKVKGKKKNATVASSGGVGMKLFSEFYKSDIILASPIGLKMATTNSEGDEDEDEDSSDVDFLTSIDVCIVARSDVLSMQNWDHVNSVLKCLNQQPKNISNIDFSRVRNYFLEGQGENWRQLIMISKFSDPYILSTFRRYAKNIEGHLKMRMKITADHASITNVTVRVKQVFQRVGCESVTEAGSSRLRYFSEHILPKLLRLKQKHTLIFIPSYFDFVAVRNLLLKQEASIVSVTEYARISEVSRGRARFHQGRKNIMLYTGRGHFFLRHKIKGARHVIFFGLPEYAEFYSDIVNMLNDGLSEWEEEGLTRMPLSSLSLYTKYDAHPLERIVGTENTEKMIKGENSSFLFSL
ncbi:hypothetical protein HJC23_001343 [Cyclotella cryptica]|uniref:U3 small nucleolar RNA-associated protein 25 n=1 Tax=Cyclotella cryptica TaxID=29204 RepID=A0ABD3PMY1_9STRA|eukprot:CCRYP_013121-RA/>CCRYP_013121-RA protein AED:0.00 eAED:0.00 QI:159/1/1/1/1/1/2/2149/890